jgi:phage terminase large subunit-like protein
VLDWCVDNLVGNPDRRGNLYPAKQRPEQRLHAAVALMTALGRAMVEEGTPDITDFRRDPIFA